MKIRLFLIVMIPAFLMTSTIGIYLNLVHPVWK
ncbi:MAG: hypothetical protein Ct9H300mP21_01020 [Pseudomonadota bacterium]|nr:MAG: hypothetical protein Ct9H300mP21_01020 [Pseudomonadota bacterium]